MAPTAPTVGIYTRISNDPSGTHLGVDRQEKIGRKLAKERGWTVGEVYVENDVSAFKGKRRPEFDRMLADVTTGRIGAIVAVDQDRLARRMQELLNVLRVCEDSRTPIVLHSGEIDTTTADGILKAHILGAVAENESRKKSERLKRQRDQAAAMGLPHSGGKRAYGYEADRLTVRKSEAKAIIVAVERVLAGASLRSIAQDMNARGLRGASEQLWGIASLRAILTGPRVAGLRQHHGEIIGEGVWPAIIDRHTWEQLRSILGDPRVNTRGRPPTTLLSGIVRCGICGCPMTGARVRASHQRNAQRTYRCKRMPNTEGCGRVTIIADRTEAIVVAALFVAVDTPALAKAKARVSKSKARSSETVDLAAIDADLAALAVDHGEGRITRGEWLAARTPLLRRRDEALTAIAADTPSGGATAYSGVGVLRQAWPNLTVEQKRAVLKSVVERIEIAPAASQGHFNADRVDVKWRA